MVKAEYSNTSMTNKEISQLTIGGKEVAKIEAGNLVLYEKQEEKEDCLILTVTGSSFTDTTYSTPEGLIGESISVDWGDGIIENSNGRLSHTYTDGLNTHAIKVYNVTSLGNACFRQCTSLTNVTIPSSVTTLGTSCFYGCTGLTSVTILSSVTTLKNYCFRLCTSLTSVTIPSSVTTLGSFSFYGCTGLVDYQLYWTTPPITWNNNYMPNNTNTYYTIPNGSTANYVAKNFPSSKLIERS